MGYLLDTHVVLWALTDPSRLTPSAHSIVANPASEVYVSAATAWEVATKHRLGKLPQADALVAGYTNHIAHLKAIRLPVTDEDALFAGGLTWTHRDPFDRLLAAQAMLGSHTFITADAVFSDLNGIRTSW